MRLLGALCNLVRACTSGARHHTIRVPSTHTFGQHIVVLRLPPFTFSFVIFARFQVSVFVRFQLRLVVASAAAAIFITNSLSNSFSKFFSFFILFPQSSLSVCRPVVLFFFFFVSQLVRRLLFNCRFVHLKSGHGHEPLVQQYF